MRRMASCETSTCPGSPAWHVAGFDPAAVDPDLLDEVLHEQRNVVLPLAQRRQFHLNHVQPVVQILAEGPSLTIFARSELVAATTRTSTLIGLLSPTRSNSRSCSTRSSFICSDMAIVPDFVEEQRAAVGLLDAARREPPRP